MSKIRVLLADDHGLVRSGLATLIALQADMALAGEAADGRRAVELSRELSPDVVLMDISMPELNGIDATRAIAALPAPPKVVAVSCHSDRRFVAEALRAGACGYVLKDCTFDELAQAIRAVVAGNAYLSPGVAGGVVDEWRQWVPGGAASPGTPTLTARERQVLQLLAEGKTTKAIAATLFVGTKTVDTHRANIMAKLGAHSVAELVKYAIREGLTSPER